MIERLSANADVLALRVCEHISHDDIDDCLRFLAEAFEAHPQIGLYVEVAHLSGFDTEALSLAFDRGVGMLGKLDRFGRVAIVSDQTWLRWVARVESAILPGISYRTYTMAEREQALAWVQGATDLPYGHAIRIIPTSRPDTAGIEINGRLTAEEVSQTVRELNERRRAKGLKAILVLWRSVAGFDPRIAVDPEYLRMKLELPAELERYGVVGGPQWLVAWLKIWQPLLSIELRHFDVREEDAAWSWIGATPQTGQPEAA